MRKKILIEKIVSFILEDSDIDTAVGNAASLGTMLWHNNLGIYGLESLEESICLRCCDLLYEKTELCFSKSAGTAFIVSEPYLTGGHTRLMELLSTFLPKKSDLIVTRKIESQCLKRMNKYFEKVILSCDSSSSSPSCHIYEIAKKLIQYDKLILNIHPDDIHTVAACSIAKKVNKNLKVYFVNHADHTFCYGQSVADVWFEISSFGKKIDSLKRIKGCKSFLGIPLANCNAARLSNLRTDVITNGDIIFTSGSALKYRPVNGMSLMPFISDILSKYPMSRLYVIGCKKYRDYWWWGLKLKFKSRVKLSSAMPYSEYLKLADKTSVFIDSYPIPGGTAFVEQLLAGKICIGLKGVFQGYSPAEMLKQNDDVECFLGEQQINIDTLRRLLSDVHSIDAVKDRFIKAVEHNIFTENLCDKYMFGVSDVGFFEKINITEIPISLKLQNKLTWLIFFNATFGARVVFFLKKIFRAFKLSTSN